MSYAARPRPGEYAKSGLSARTPSAHRRSNGPPRGLPQFGGRRPADSFAGPVAREADQRPPERAIETDDGVVQTAFRILIGLRRKRIVDPPRPVLFSIAIGVAGRCYRRERR